MVSLSRTIGLGLLVLAAIGFLSAPAFGQLASESKAGPATHQRARPEPSPAPLQDFTADKAKPYQPACQSPKSEGEVELCETIKANNIADENLFWVRLGTVAVLLSLIFTGMAAVAAAQAAKAAKASVEHAEADAAAQAQRFSDQLGVTRQSADAATGAALASAEANKMTRLIGKVEVGASVSIPSASLTVHENGDVTMTMGIENEGRSKASKITVKSVMNFYAIAGNITNFTFAEQKVGKLDRKDSKMLSWHYRLLKEQVVRFRERGVVEILAFGSIDYEDIFGDSVELTFCFRSDGAQSIKEVGGLTELKAVPLAEVYGRRTGVQEQVDDHRQVPHPNYTPEEQSAQVPVPKREQ